MSIIGQNILAGASGGGLEELTIEQSCRFNATNTYGQDSAKLTRTPGTTGDRKTWTLSVWCKRASKTQACTIFGTTGGVADKFAFHDDYLASLLGNSTSGVHTQLTLLLKDRSAWYHVMWVLDTTQSTDTDRNKMYLNGVQVPVSGPSTFPAEDYETAVNSSSYEQEIGCVGGGEWYGGYLAEMNLIDGQALEPSDFGFFKATTNQWVATEYTGTYGTNGFRMKFQNSAALGDDSSGNNNDFAVTNLVATDQVKDSPTNNFATLNPLYQNSLNAVEFAEGDLFWEQTSAAHTPAASTIAVGSGKWYFEGKTIAGDSVKWWIGMADAGSILQAASSTNLLWGSETNGTFGGDNIGFYENPIRKNNVIVQNNPFASSMAANDICMMAMDCDNGKVWFGKNGVWNNGDPGDSSGRQSTTLNTSYEDTTFDVTRDYYMGIGAENSEWYANYGQDSSFAGTSTAGGNADANGVGDFYYTVPANHLALCTSNLPDPSIELPGAYFNTILYDDGAGAKTGVGFAPDLVWLKSRGSANSHKWTDVVRGVTKGLSSDSSANETTDSTGLTAFGSDGFTVGADGNYSDTTGTGMVGWNWLAGGATTVTNTDGTRDSEVTANTAAGFSIIEFAGINDTTLTVGHGLSVAPTLVISKNRDESGSWLVYVPSLTNGKNLILNTNAAESTQTAYIQGQSNTASVIQLNQSGGNDNLGRTGDTVIMYAFHSVEGYSKVDVYKGNDNSNGPFVYTGFTPAWIMTKALTSAYDWGMWDITRSVYNPVSNILEADNNQAELTGTKPLGPWGQGLPIDILSNGFKVRTTAGEVGANNIYAYVAFAKSPFKYSNAR